MRIFFYVVIINFLLSSIVCASEINTEALKQFKESLMQLKQVAIEFYQTDSKGLKAEGKLLISKPYKFRCNYYPPYPLVIIGNKNYVSVYDYELEQLSRMSTADNIFGFLLTEHLELDKQFIIETAKLSNEILQVTLYHISSQRRSRITFDKNKQQLKSLEIFEEDNTIYLDFKQFQTVKRFDPSLFIIKKPELFGKPERLDRTQIVNSYSAF